MFLAKTRKITHYRKIKTHIMLNFLFPSKRSFQRFILWLCLFLIVIYCYTRLKNTSLCIYNCNVPNTMCSKVKNNVLSNHSVYIRNSKSNMCQSLILLWTPYFGMEPLEMLQLKLPWFYKANDCPNVNCEFTSDRSKVLEADAIVFHSRDINRSDFPKARHEDQVWVYMEQESPVHSINILEELNEIFNWTMTYRRDSNVYYPYGQVVASSDNKDKFNKRICFNSGCIMSSSEVAKSYSRKTEFILAFISNCNAPSHRDLLISELQKYVPVHVYGKCGKYKCDRDSNDSCYSQLVSRYKFYLSFENSLCTDYATEKFFKPLSNYIVPIVYGLSDYESIAPSKSYINVNDFDSIKLLADYLKFLNDTPTEYLSFFSWKQHYKVLTAGYGWCDICNKLGERKHLKFSLYENLKEWWLKLPKNDNDNNNARFNYKRKFHYANSKSVERYDLSNLYSACWTPPS